MNIIDFIRDPKLINSDLSPYQETALRLLYGLPLNDQHQAIAQQATERDFATTGQRVFSEATFICGRRSGKPDRRRC